MNITKPQRELLREISAWDYPDGVWLEQLGIGERAAAGALIRRGLAVTTGEGGKLCATRTGHTFMRKTKSE